MVVVVDTNILFSAITNSSGKIANVFFSKKQKFKFYSSTHLLVEIKKHQRKLIEHAGYDVSTFKFLLSSFVKRIKFIEQKKISTNSWNKAEKLTSEIDLDDIYFVALSIELNAFLWTGDKKLYCGLKSKNYKKVITTQELNKYTYKKILHARI